MKLKIVGINHQKLIISLKNLLKAFNREHEIVLENYDYIVIISTISYEKDLKCIIKCSDLLIQEKIEIIEDTYYELKYLILRCFYRLLVKMTGQQLSYGVLTGIRPTKLVHRYKQKYNDIEVLSLLQNKYLISEDKAQLLHSVVNHQLDICQDFSGLRKEVSVYINIPFCLSRCHYCSFTSYPSDYQKVTQNKYMKTLIDEVKCIGNYLKDNHIRITTIYIGGGTPTALNDELLKLLLDQIKIYLLYQNVQEFTLECGRPDSLTDSKLAIIKNASVSRISINPQTFNENTLIQMNRNHSTDDIKTIYNKAKKMGFDNINMDLIIGLPGETIDDYKQSIEKTIELNPESITVHYLAQKKGSSLYHEKINRQLDDYFQAFTYAYRTLLNHKYIPYYLYRQKNIVGNLENIGYCLKGKASLYNILMIEEVQNIIGLGCDASSKFINYDLVLNPKDLKTYINSYKEYLDKKIHSLEVTLK